MSMSTIYLDDLPGLADAVLVRYRSQGGPRVAYVGLCADKLIASEAAPEDVVAARLAMGRDEVADAVAEGRWGAATVLREGEPGFDILAASLLGGGWRDVDDLAREAREAVRDAVRGVMAEGPAPRPMSEEDVDARGGWDAYDATVTTRFSVPAGSDPARAFAAWAGTRDGMAELSWAAEVATLEPVGRLRGADTARAFDEGGYLLDQSGRLAAVEYDDPRARVEDAMDAATSEVVAQAAAGEGVLRGVGADVVAEVAADGDLRRWVEDRVARLPARERAGAAGDLYANVLTATAVDVAREGSTVPDAVARTFEETDAARVVAEWREARDEAGR